MDEKLRFVDELARDLHSFVRPTDYCYYLLEYTKVPEGTKSWDLGPTNNLIANFKKKPDRRGLPEWRYKEQAIRDVGARLRRAVDATFPTFFQVATLVPIPGSKCKSDPEHDPRMLEALQVMCAGVPGADLRELLVQTRSLPRAHESEVRPTINDIAACCAVNETVAAPEPQVIVLFDDVLTSGAHYRAAHQVLGRRFPEARVVGIFIARRVFPVQPGEDVLDW